MSQLIALFLSMKRDLPPLKDLLFTHGGNEMSTDGTPMSLGIKDGDTICVERRFLLIHVRIKGGTDVKFRVNSRVEMQRIR